MFPLLLDKPAYVLKQELIRVPLFGSYLKRCGMIPVDREGGGSALKQCCGPPAPPSPKAARSSSTPKARARRPASAAPITPASPPSMATSASPSCRWPSTPGLFWGRRAFHKKPGTITIEFLPPIAPGLPRREFMRELQERMEGASQRLAAAERGKARHSAR